jgi:hypothetical protein
MGFLKVRAKMREKAAWGTLWCRSGGSDKVLAEPQVVVPRILGAEPSRAGRESHSSHMCECSAVVLQCDCASKRHLVAKPFLSWSCNI